MTIHKYIKVLFILMFIASSIYFVNNILIDNKVYVGVVTQDHSKNFIGKEDIIAILYGKKTCTYCQSAVAALEKQGITYLYKNIKESPEALEEFSALGGRAIPLVITRHLKITGFQDEWYLPEVLIANQLPEENLVNE